MPAAGNASWLYVDVYQVMPAAGQVLHKDLGGQHWMCAHMRSSDKGASPPYLSPRIVANPRPRACKISY